MSLLTRRTATTALRTTRLTPTALRRTYAGPSASPNITDPSSAKQPEDESNSDVLRKGAKRDPELYVKHPLPIHQPPHPTASLTNCI
jgi:hypothetical protein